MQANDYADSPVYVESLGDGKPLVVLHGWGMHGGMFRDALSRLQRQVQLVDLPGHGYSKPFANGFDIDSYTDYLVEQLRLQHMQDFVLLGWSMGGLLAQSIAARLRDKVSKLVLLTATPCFVNKVDWQFGVEKSAIEMFAADLVSDYEKTLSRFLAIQFLGINDQKELLRNVKKLVFAKPAPDSTMLEQGLQLLDETDLRDRLAHIHCPTLIINGECDSLIPTSAAAYLAEHIPNARAVIIKGAGHAPFLSHASLFTKYLEDFIDV